jgi:hypothetical protein
MKNIKFIASLFLVLVFTMLSTSSYAQDVFASTMKIGPFKPGMPQKEVESVLLKKLTANEVKASMDNYEKPMKVVLNNVDFYISFYDETYGDEKLDRKYAISKVRCNDAKVKTKSGVAIGMTKYEVMKILDKQKIGYNYNINTYENEDKKKVVNEYLLIHDDKAGTNLQLEFKDGKINNFSVQAASDGC